MPPEVSFHGISCLLVRCCRSLGQHEPMAFPASVVLVSGRLGFQQKEAGWARAVCHYLNQKVLISRLVLDSPARKFGGLRLGDLWKGIADGRERQGEPDYVAEKTRICNASCDVQEAL